MAIKFHPFIYLPVSIYMYEFSLLCPIFLSFIHLSESLFYRQLEIFTSLVIIFQVSVSPAFLCPDHLPEIVHLLRILVTYKSRTFTFTERGIQGSIPIGWRKCGKFKDSCSHERTAFHFLISIRRLCSQT